MANFKIWIEPPPTSTLTITYCSNSPESTNTSTFTATLSNAIPSTATTISSLSINGYGSFKCISFSPSTDSISANLVVSAGATSGTIAGSTPIDKSTDPYGNFINSVVVNGTTLNNNDTTTIGVTIVTLSISTTCDLLSSCG